MVRLILILLLLPSLAVCKKASKEVEGKKDTTQVSSCPKLPRFIKDTMPTNQLLDLVQKQTIKYFWDFAEPVSGMARERNTSGNTVTTGGTGFGIMAIIVGAERNFITREAALDRILHICRFLKDADRFHGAWSHWIDGTTGKTIPFSTKDNGGDLVETAFLVQGLITAREYFNGNNSKEDSLRRLTDSLWYEVDWNWYRNNQDVLFWHWSPNYNFEMNHKITGWNEAMIVYVLAASSPTHPIKIETYEKGWAGNGSMKNGKTFYGTVLPLGPDYGGPLFFSHYSFLGLDPRHLKDQYADYWQQGKAHSLINFSYCKANPRKFCSYSDSCWGLTASDDPKGYNAHAPYDLWGIDNGTISPTAALSSMPYTPQQSIAAMKFFYYNLSNKIWGNYGFQDAFNIEKNWYSGSYLAIDQGPIVVMIENYRTGLIWNTFMKNKDIFNGLITLKISNNNK